MNHYITQLIEDLKALQRAPMEPWYRPGEGMELEYADVKQFLCGGHEQQISTLFDLQPEQFPPPKRLTTSQMQAITLAYAELLLSWGICLVIPESVPVEMAYETAVGALERKVSVSQYGMVTLEFCSYIPEKCPFGEWCHC